MNYTWEQIEATLQDWGMRSPEELQWIKNDLEQRAGKTSVCVSNTEYAVSFVDSRQISEDRWAVYQPQKKCTEATTLGEIRQWWETRQYNTPPDTRSKMIMDGVVINQLQ